jgi:hypothetical protein
MHNTPVHPSKPIAQVKLSDIVVRSGIYTNSKRLSVPNHGISIIDAVSDKYRKI